MGSPIVFNAPESGFDAAMRSGTDYFSAMNKTAADKAQQDYKVSRDSVGDARNAATDAESVKNDNLNQSNSDRTFKSAEEQRKITNKAAAVKGLQEAENHALDKKKTALEIQVQRGILTKDAAAAIVQKERDRLYIKYGDQTEQANIEGLRLGNSSTRERNEFAQVDDPLKIESDRIGVGNLQRGLRTDGSDPNYHATYGRGGRSGGGKEPSTNLLEDKGLQKYYSASKATRASVQKQIDNANKFNTENAKNQGEDGYQAPPNLPAEAANPAAYQPALDNMIERIGDDGKSLPAALKDLEMTAKVLPPKDPHYAANQKAREALGLPPGPVDPIVFKAIENRIKEVVKYKSTAKTAAASGGGSSANAPFTTSKGHEIVSSAAQEFGVPLQIMDSLWAQESSRGRNVNEGKGELGGHGWFQLTYTSGAPQDVMNRAAKDPVFASRVAANQLAKLKQQFGTWENAIEAYNAGSPGTRDGKKYLAEVLGRIKNRA